MEVPHNIKEFVAGFIDGDGSILLPRPHTTSQRPLPVVILAQSYNDDQPPELLFVQRYYGGNLHIIAAATNAHRCCWQLHIKSETLVTLLEDLGDHAIVKRGRASSALRYIESERDDPIFHYHRMRAVSKLEPDISVDHARLTDAYLAGLFAAEGSIGFYRTKRGGVNNVNIAQAACVPLLSAIRTLLGFGNINPDGISFPKLPSLRFLDRIAPYLIGQKQRQVVLYMQFHARYPLVTRAKSTNQKRLAEAEEVAREMKRLKRM